MTEPALSIAQMLANAAYSDSSLILEVISAIEYALSIQVFSQPIALTLHNALTSLKALKDRCEYQRHLIGTMITSINVILHQALHPVLPIQPDEQAPLQRNQDIPAGNIPAERYADDEQDEGQYLSFF